MIDIPVSYIKLIQIVENFCDEHLFIQRFASDFEDKFNDYSHSGRTYPFVYMAPREPFVTFENDQDIFSVRFYVTDLIQENEYGTNKNYIISDASRICRHIKQYFSEENATDSPVYHNNPEADATAIQDFGVDNLAGAYIDLDLNCNSTSLCEIPFANTPIISGYTCDIYYTTDYLTCNNFSACTAIEAYVTQIVIDEIAASVGPTANTYTTGVTFTGTIATFHRNDFGTYTLNLSGLSDALSAITTTALSATSISATTFYSGSTNLEQIIYNIAVGAEDITRVQPGLNTYTGGTANFPTVNISAATLDHLTVTGETVLNTLSAATLSATSIYSGSTNLQDIFALIGSGDVTRVQNGLNTYTGGTPNFPTVNISAATLNSLIVTGDTVLNSLSAVTLSATTLYSGSTNLETIISNIANASDDNDITRVQPGTNTYTGGTANAPTVNISAATLNSLTVTGNTILTSLSAITASATTYYSGSTNLETIISNIAAGYDTNDITRVQPGTNIQTGGTANSPIVSTVDSPSFNNVYFSGTASGNIVSATTLYSAGTNLETVIYNIANNSDDNDITRVQNGTNTYTGGTANLPTVNISAATLNSLTVTGNTILSSLSAVTASATTFYSGSTNLETIISNIAGTGGGTYVQPGTNTYTGGTANRPTVNVSAATLDHLTVTGDTILATTSATTLAVLNNTSASTQFRDYNGNVIESGVSLSNIVGGLGNRILADNNNIQIIGGYYLTASTDTTTYVSNLIVTGTTHGNLNATNLFSGSTNLQDIFVTSATLTRVQPGTNTYTGGTFTAPTVNISAATLNSLTVSGSTTLGATSLGATNATSLTATTVSASTLYSGSTNIGTMFASATKFPVELFFAVSNDTTAITTGTSKFTMYTPYAFTLTNAIASLSVSGSLSSTTFDIKLTGTTIFNTNQLVIDKNQYSSAFSVTQPTITATTIPANSRLSVDITVAGSGATGAKIFLIGNRTI